MEVDALALAVTAGQTAAAAAGGSESSSEVEVIKVIHPKWDVFPDGPVGSSAAVLGAAAGGLSKKPAARPGAAGTGGDPSSPEGDSGDEDD